MKAYIKYYLTEKELDLDYRGYYEDTIEWDTSTMGDIPKNIVYMKIVETDLDGGIMDVFDSFEINLPKLLILEISGKCLTSFNAERYTKNLKKLIIEDNDLEEFIPNSKLQYFTLENSNIVFTESLYNTELIYLRIDKCQLNNLILPKNLKYLYLIDCNLKEFIFNYPELEVLDLSDNKLTEFILPSENKLEILSINTNKLKEFKIDLESKLNHLSISNNLLTKFIPNKYLEYLNIISNDLTEFVPNEFLKELYISNNKLTNFNMNEKLKILEITDNPLKILNPNNSFNYIAIKYYSDPYYDIYLDTYKHRNNSERMYKNFFLSRKIISRRRIYLLSETKDICNKFKTSEKICYKCKRIVSKELKINIRQFDIYEDSIINRHDNLEKISISYESCC